MVRLGLVFVLAIFACGAAELPVIPGVEGQPLGANGQRLLQALEILGHALPAERSAALREAARRRDADALQQLLDPAVLLVVHINPELRVKVSRGPALPILQQDGYTPVVVKVLNDGKASQRLRLTSPQSGPPYAGAAAAILERQQQTDLKQNENTLNDPGRFLHMEMFDGPPMTEHLGGLKVEYAIALIYSSEAGSREATLGFDIGQGTQDLGFRGETAVLFDIRPARMVRLSIRDQDGTPTTARLTFRDTAGRVFPPQARRLAPDFFFQPHIYRKDGDRVRLPPGQLEVTYTRGPEYLEGHREITVPESGEVSCEIRLLRWVDPMAYGYVSGDHHIHAAGCSHYEIPTQGVTPEAMFQQVKGEALNVGCVLTWGPCYSFQRQFFDPGAAPISEPLTVLKYDLEISGFGSEALGHVCLLNLQDQTYPGSHGDKTKGWPTWTVPVMRWAKEQGGVTGYPHSDMFVDAKAYAERFLQRHDRNADGRLDVDEAAASLLPKPRVQMDADHDGFLNLDELRSSADRSADELPNLVLPSMRGAGAMEIFVSAAEGVCDFISAMNTGRVGEWNTWYHLMNCGFPLKVSGETDFPCMSSRQVGQGRVYVRMAEGPVERVEFGAWCRALAQGRSYVSDGYAHALEFTVNGVSPGRQDVSLAGPGPVGVRARVAFAASTPKAVAHGTLNPPKGRRDLGDTRVLHAPRSQETVEGGDRLVEIIVNGIAVAGATVPADGQVHDLDFRIAVERSSWLAVRHFPQMHSNPVNVRVAGRPIRASAESARWCAESVELLWENRSRHIAEPERAAARASYDRAIALYQARAKEAAQGNPDE